MIHQCKWCGCLLPKPAGEDPADNRVSHGICETCLEKHFPEDPDTNGAIEKREVANAEE